MRQEADHDEALQEVVLNPHLEVPHRVLPLHPSLHCRVVGLRRSYLTPGHRDDPPNLAKIEEGTGGPNKQLLRIPNQGQCHLVAQYRNRRYREPVV